MNQAVPHGHSRRLHPDWNRKSYGEQLKPDREHDKQYQSHPKGRRTGSYQGIGRDNSVRSLSLLCPGNDSHEKSNQSRQNPCRRHNPKGIGQLLPDYLGNRPAVQKGDTHISLKKITGPGQITGYRRRVDAPVFLESGNLLAAHASKGRLPHIGGKRIQGRNRHQEKRRHTHQHQQNRHPYEINTRLFPTHDFILPAHIQFCLILFPAPLVHIIYNGPSVSMGMDFLFRHL
jgi:hypothetical protein